MGSRHLGSQFGFYRKAILNIHFFATIMFSIIVGFIGFVFRTTYPLISITFIGVSISLPFLLLYWLFRQVCYIQSNPKRAFSGSLLYAVLLLSSLIILRKANIVSPFSSFIVMAFASAVSVFIFWPKLNNSPDSLAGTSKTYVRNIIVENFSYGKWVLLTAVFYGISTFLYQPIIAYFFSLSDAGFLKAMQNLILPLQQVITAFSLLFLPWLVKNKLASGPSFVFQKVNKLGILYLVLTGIYVVPLILFGCPIIHFIYASDQLVSYNWVLPFLCLVSLFTSLYSLSSMALRALERPDVIFQANVASAVFTLIFGIVLVKEYGFPGAIISITGSSFLLFIFVFIKHVSIARQNNQIKV